MIYTTTDSDKPGPAGRLNEIAIWTRQAHGYYTLYWEPILTDEEHALLGDTAATLADAPAPAEPLPAGRPRQMSLALPDPLQPALIMEETR